MFLILIYIHSMFSLFRVFVMNGCWTLLNVCSPSIDIIMWFVTFILHWSVAFIDWLMLNHPCVPGIKSHLAVVISIFMYCLIQLTSILLRLLHLYSSRVLVYGSIMSSCGFGIVVDWRVQSPYICLNVLRIDITFSLNLDKIQQQNHAIWGFSLFTGVGAVA